MGAPVRPKRLKRITTALQAGVDRGESPGAVVLIARKGKIACFESVGYRGRIAEPQIDAATGKRPPMPDRTSKPNVLSGGGGMVSTAAGYARFCKFLNKGQLDGVRVLSRTTVEYMASDHVPPGARVNNFPVPVLDTKADNGQSFGLGFSVRVSAGRSPIPGSTGSVGWTGASGPSFVVDPKEELSAVFLVQNGIAASRAAYWTMMRALACQAAGD